MVPLVNAPEQTRRRRRPRGLTTTAATLRLSVEVDAALEAEAEEKGVEKTLLLENVLRRRYRLRQI